MFLTRTKYDHKVNTFSPEGRLFQVEYAIEAIMLGSTAIGLKMKVGVVLAIENSHLSFADLVSAPRPNCPPVRRVTSTYDEKENAMEYGLPSSHALNIACLSRGVVYGDQLRNCLDLYFPKDAHGLKLVVAFITSDAWIIGYKAWGELLERRLSERGVLVACIDYRNFPQGTISDMVRDAYEGISFVCNIITSIGRDTNRCGY